MRRHPTLPLAGAALLLVGAALPSQAQRVTVAVGATADVRMNWPGELEDPVAPHARVGVALRPLTSRWNVEADAFHTEFRPASYRSFYYGEDGNPSDWGASLSGTYTLRASRTLAPFVRLGAAHVVTRTDVVEYRTESDFQLPQPTRRYVTRESGTVAVLGAGANLRLGQRMLRLEARFQGGATPNVPITLGFSF